MFAWTTLANRSWGSIKCPVRLLGSVVLSSDRCYCLARVYRDARRESESIFKRGCIVRGGAHWDDFECHTRILKFSGFIARSVTSLADEPTCNLLTFVSQRMTYEQRPRDNEYLYPPTRAPALF